MNQGLQGGSMRLYASQTICNISCFSNIYSSHINLLKASCLKMPSFLIEHSDKLQGLTHDDTFITSVTICIYICIFIYINIYAFITLSCDYRETCVALFFFLSAPSLQLPSALWNAEPHSSRAPTEVLHISIYVLLCPAFRNSR